MPTDPINLFCECVAGNPYFVARHITKHRMNLGFLNLAGLAMLCAASQSANIADNICLTYCDANPKQTEFEDFTAYLQNFDAQGQLIYLINICWSLRALGWNLVAVNACEVALQGALIEVGSPSESIADNLADDLDSQ